MYLRQALPVLLFGLLASAGLQAQNVRVVGRFTDASNGQPPREAWLRALDMVFPLPDDGLIDVLLGDPVPDQIEVGAPGFASRTFTRSGKAATWDLGAVALEPEKELVRQRLAQEIPVIELTEADFDENATGNVSGLLQASRDPFVRAAAFQFSAARFRIRGYESRYTSVLVNGISANDPGNGDVFWSEWAGLNDVMRTQENLVGLVYHGDAMANMGGLTTFDTRAHRQRKQTRVSYAVSNRTYTNRIMATHSTGWMNNGWALSVSGSRRWAETGYIPGTFFDAWSYFMSVDKRLARNHILNVTFLGSPVRRGRSSGSTQEQYDLAGTNFYNPFWGYQEGKVRNSRVQDVHQPLAILRYDWKINRNSALMLSLSGQDGRFGSSSLEWNGGRDPRAEYYRRWPSSVQDPVVAQQMREALAADEALRQVDWAYMYQANRNNPVTIEDVNGIPGNSVSGNRSLYMVQEFRSDARTLQGRLVFQSSLKNRHLFSAGLQGQQMQTHYFKKALDLLGGDFWLDIDRFAEFDFPNNPDILQNNLDQPNRLVAEGDHFGYDYRIHTRNAQAWAQMALSGARWDGFFGGELGFASFHREGLVRTGRFPDNSLGKSAVQDFLTWKAKGGLTYKIDGRNYLSAAVFASANAPDFQNGFISPRTRHDVVPDLPAEQVYSGELSYKLQAPTFKFRATGYATEIRDQVNVLTFFNDLANTFGNYILTGIHRRHIGTEWGMDWKLTPALEVNAAAAMGLHYFTDRAKATVIQDNTGLPVYTNRTVFIRNFRLDGMPQEAFSLGATYNSRKFWYANIQANYFHKAFLDFSPDRRTAAALEGVEPGSDKWNNIIRQEELPGAFMLNVFGGKSWKIKRTFLYLNVGINNILDNTSYRTGGFEQLRFDDESRDVSRFPNRYFYAFGRNYFVNFSVRL